MSKIATIISYVFHPLLMTTFLFLAMYLTNAAPVIMYSSAFFQLLLVIFLVTFVIPAISISFLKLSRTITSFKLENRKERIIPFSFVTVFYGVAYWMFMSKIGLSGPISIILLSITFMILLLTVITIFWKISAHSLGVGGVIGFLSAFYLMDSRKEGLVALAVALTVAGMVMASRLQLNAHNPRQVYAGLFLGFIFSFVSIIIFA